jgi:hypothetical protein|tara:strand:- start:218 stop:772 length:555 start_codon:yes stop_codon:yes gene_type:complete
MPRRSNIVPLGCLYLLREKSKYDAFTLGPDPEFPFTLFSCVSLAAVKILRAINRRTSVQMASVQFKCPVAGSPEYVSLSNSLMAEYALDKVAKYKEVKVLMDLGFIEEHERKSWNSSRVVRINPNIMQYKNICKDKQMQKRVKEDSIRLRKRTRPKYIVKGNYKYTEKYNRETSIWETARIQEV